MTIRPIKLAVPTPAIRTAIIYIAATIPSVIENRLFQCPVKKFPFIIFPSPSPHRIPQ